MESERAGVERESEKERERERKTERERDRETERLCFVRRIARGGSRADGEIRGT